MNELALLPDWGIGVMALVLVAVIFFALAIASGRWALWLLGYLAILAALAVVLLTARSRAQGATGSDRPPVTLTQPSAGSGVLDDAPAPAEVTIGLLETDGPQ